MLLSPELLILFTIPMDPKHISTSTLFPGLLLQGPFIFDCNPTPKRPGMKNTCGITVHRKPVASSLQLAIYYNY